jgi:diadenosine tetraphosphate (Ap4A) HIT family hydrolase
LRKFFAHGGQITLETTAISDGAMLSPMPTLIHGRVEDCRQGRNPKTIARVQSGWVVLGDVQFLRGYSLLLPDPVVVDLNSMTKERRETYLYEMSVIGDALLAITDAYRINYEILGNTEPALHAHIFPRYHSEPDDLRRLPVWVYDWEQAPTFEASRDQPLMEQIAQYLDEASIAF